MNDKLDGYQRLEQDFFRLCGLRNIKHSAMLVLIYLRGLYCWFQKPTFHYPDKNIVKDLNLSRKQLNRIRKLLQERGVIEYKSYEGRGKETDYFILKTELAPEIKGNKMSPFNRQNVTFSPSKSSIKRCQNVPSKVIYSKEKSKDNFQLNSLENIRTNFAKKQGWL